MSDEEHLRSTILDLHYDRCDNVLVELSGEVTIGVVDSVYDPGEFANFHQFGRSFDIINANVGATHPHGYEVLQILTAYTYDSEFHLFQSISEGGKTHDSYLMKAIGKAKEFEEVDVLNLSVGCDHVSNPDKECTESRSACALCEVAEEAIEAGITIVAAAGNYPHVESVCCPSLSDYAISVGGVVDRCTANPNIGQSLNPQPTVSYPPNAYWIDREDGKGAQEAYCSGRGCYPGETCQNNRVTELWEHNVPFTDRKPDTLAPVHLLWADEVGPFIDEGTSFSAPIVTANIVNLLEWARSEGDNVSPAEIRQAISNTGTVLERSNHRSFSGLAFVNEIRTNRGLNPYRPDQDDWRDFEY